MVRGALSDDHLIQLIVVTGTLNGKKYQDKSWNLVESDKRDDFNFEIVNFPFLDGDVPRSPSYGVYIS